MMPPIFACTQDRRAAQRLLKEGMRSGSWSACGYALVIDRLDRLIALTETIEVLDEDDQDDER
jgi:hypothetical protein